MKRVLDLTMPKVEADKEDMHSHSTNKQPTMPKFARSDFQRSRSYEDLASSYKDIGIYIIHNTYIELL